MPARKPARRKARPAARRKTRRPAAPKTVVDATIVGRLPAGWTAKKVSALATLAAAQGGFRGKGIVSVKLVADPEMRALNKMYRDKDKTTDVLSFGYTSLHTKDSPPPHLPTSPTELGDIVISMPQVRRQAKAIGRDVAAEFALMVVHGVLHILGHDHETLAQERRMFALQHETLLRSGHF